MFLFHFDARVVCSGSIAILVILGNEHNIMNSLLVSSGIWISFLLYISCQTISNSRKEQDMMHPIGIRMANKPAMLIKFYHSRLGSLKP